MISLLTPTDNRYPLSTLTRPRRPTPEWWRMSGSNRRPPACKAGALPAELIPRRLLSIGGALRRCSQPCIQMYAAAVRALHCLPVETNRNWLAELVSSSRPTSVRENQARQGARDRRVLLHTRKCATPHGAGYRDPMVGLVGFEPTTPALSRRCSNRLSYRPVVCILNNR